MESLLCLGNPSKAILSPPCIPRSSHLLFRSYTINPSTVCARRSPSFSVDSLRFAENPLTINPFSTCRKWSTSLYADSLRFTISALDRPEKGLGNENVEKCKKTLQTTLKTSLVFLCAIGLVGASGFMKITTPTAAAITIEGQDIEPHMISLMTVKKVLDKKKVDNDLADYKIRLHQLAIDRKGEKDLVKRLKDIYQAEKKKNLLDESHIIEVEMALIEVLICLGEFEEASMCDCLNNPKRLEEDKDKCEVKVRTMFYQRIHLYKAIVSAMLVDDDVLWQHGKKVLHIYNED